MSLTSPTLMYILPDAPGCCEQLTLHTSAHPHTHPHTRPVVVNDAVCAGVSSWSRARGATAPLTCLLTWKNTAVTPEREESRQTIGRRRHSEGGAAVPSGRLLGASSQPLTDRFKRLLVVGPWSPLNYESNQAVLNSERAGESLHDTLGSHQ